MSRCFSINVTEGTVGMLESDVIRVESLNNRQTKCIPIHD